MLLIYFVMMVVFSHYCYVRICRSSIASLGVVFRGNVMSGGDLGLGLGLGIVLGLICVFLR